MEDEWEERMFQEWEDREFADAIASDLPSIEIREQVEFAIRELIAALENLADVVDRSLNTYNKMVPSTLHVALMTLMAEIENWDVNE